MPSKTINITKSNENQKSINNTKEVDEDKKQPLFVTTERKRTVHWG